MKAAQQIWMKLSGDDEVKAQIKAIEKYEMDKKSELTIAMRKGLEKGLKEGLKEGEKKGIEKEQREIALNMKKQGLDDDFIAKCLNISISKLNELFA